MLSNKCDYNNTDECDVIGIDPIETFENIEPITPNETINSIVSSNLLELEEQSQPDKTFYQYETDNIDNLDEPNEFKQEPSELPFIELIPLVSLKQNDSFEHIELDEFYKYIKWSKKILQLNIRDLNIYIKNHPVSHCLRHESRP